LDGFWNKSALVKFASVVPSAAHEKTWTILPSEWS
jgi:hypothetical protein